MQRIWNDIKNHPLALALFMLWCAALALLNFIVRRHEQESVAQLFFVAPAIAGALVCWWRLSRADRITVGTMAGAIVFLLQFALMLPRELTEAVHRGKGLFGVLRVLVDVETLGIGAFSCVVGAVLGFLGALGAVALAHAEKVLQREALDTQLGSGSPSTPAAEVAHQASAITDRRIMPRRVLVVAGGLVLVATVILASGTFGRAAIPPPIIMVNLLVAAALFAPMSRWSDDAGRALSLIAGLVSFSLGSAVLVFAGVKWAERPAMLSVALSAGALAELGAGVLALFATFRKPAVHCSIAPVTT